MHQKRSNCCRRQIALTAYVCGRQHMEMERTTAAVPSCNRSTVFSMATAVATTRARIQRRRDNKSGGGGAPSTRGGRSAPLLRPRRTETEGGIEKSLSTAQQSIRHKLLVGRHVTHLDEAVPAARSPEKRGDRKWYRPSPSTSLQEKQSTCFFAIFCG